MVSAAQSHASSPGGEVLGRRGVPWYAWLSLATTAAVVCGEHWDISWHMSVGRDTLWTPPHLLIQSGAVLSAIVFGFLILRSTFSRDHRFDEECVRIFGLTAPIGAFMAAWGAATMISSVPFDNWWHNAYGLDVKVLSPPHFVLGLGIIGIELGGAALVCSAMNRAVASGDRRWQRKLAMVVIAIGAFLLIQTTTGGIEYLNVANMHSAIYYRVACVAVLPPMIAMSLIARERWGATAIATLYTIVALAFLWTLPLIPAEPKLGPVYAPVSRMVPLSFPLLLVLPAIVIDLLRPRIENLPRWTQAAIFGPLFLAIFLGIHWPFANFLVSPAAMHWPFHSDKTLHAYFVPPQWLDRLWPEPIGTAFWIGMFAAVVVSIVTARIGLALGHVGRRVWR